MTETAELNPPISYDSMPRRKIVCLDMKSFYASVEAVKRGLDPFRKMLAVIGDADRPGSVILAASPALKSRYGIGTGDRVFDLPSDEKIITVEPRMSLYIERSLEITELLTEFAPIDDIFVYSIDESWIDLTDVPDQGKGFRRRARELQHEIYRRFNLVASLGLGPNMFIAKAAMDIEGKKTGLARWTYEDIPEKLWPAELSECWGIGSRLEKKFNQYGIKKVGDIARLDEDFFERRLGVMGRQIYQHAWGIDFSRPEGFYDSSRSSFGRGITLFEDYKNRQRLLTVIYNLCEEICFRARRDGLAGRTVSLGLAFSHSHPESGLQAQKTMSSPCQLEGEVTEACSELLEENYRGEPVRRVNVALSNLSSAEDIRLDFFSDRSRRRQLAQIRDQIRRQHGAGALSFGRSLCEKNLHERIKYNIGGHKA